jgi:hypothetical protein
MMQQAVKVDQKGAAKDSGAGSCLDPDSEYMGKKGMKIKKKKTLITTEKFKKKNSITTGTDNDS